ncbi:MAG: hypothetical protein IJX14_03680 [Clostridia bacterium]|nr:hypothetical protein [Clostridia bacterium]
MTELQSTFKSLVVLLLALAVMGATAYTVGLIEHWNREELHPEVFGIARLYEGEERYTMPVYFWQGKGTGEPAVFSGRSHSGDVLGNSSAFSLRLLKPANTFDSVDWRGYAEEKYMYPLYATPVFTVRNETGGEIFAVYEYPGYGQVVYSTDVTRRPVEYDGWLDDQWLQFVTGISAPTLPGGGFESRYDVYTSYSGMVSGVAEEVVIHVAGNPFWTLYKGYRDWCMTGYPAEDVGMPDKPADADEYGEFRYPAGASYVSFSSLYPRCSAVMRNVGRYEVTSYLDIYAMDPADADEVIVTAQIRLVHYTPWLTDTTALFDGWGTDSLTEEQKKELKFYGEGSHWGCRVTMGKYEEEMRMQN